eukprot:Selendium_serpulae@DN4189_c0_g1_i2.p1
MSDNVSLVERVKYFRQLGGKEKAGGDAQFSSVAGAYGEAYESRLNDEAVNDLESGPSLRGGKVLEMASNDPYSQFRSTERIRKLHGLSVPERILVKYGTLVFAARPTRVIALSYLASLHCLVALMLLKMTMAVT